MGSYSVYTSERGVMASSAPTIVRTEHKFGDYLSKPDLARFELPRKTSRPLIVNKTYGTDKIDKNRENCDTVEYRNVFPKMKQNKYERRKMVGSNKKDVRNINDIIASDNQNLTQIDTTQPSSTTEASKTYNDKTTQWTYHHQNENVPLKMPDVNPHDATIDKFHRTPQEIQTNLHQENDEEMDEKMRNLERDIELEQQQMMNRLYNNPSTFDSSFVSVGLMPVMVHNPAGGYYIVHLPIHPPPPPPQYLPDSLYSTSSCCYPVSHSSTSSSISRLSSDEGFVDDNESNDDAISLVESFEDKLEISEEESDEDDELNRLEIEKDEELNRLVLSIIDED